MRASSKIIGLCIMFVVFLLNGCCKQPSEETLPIETQSTTLPTTQPTQQETNPSVILEDDYPMFTVPSEPETIPEPTQPQEDEETDSSAPAETTPPVSTRPSEEQEPPKNTEPSENTPPTEPSDQRILDEDELPPIILSSN